MKNLILSLFTFSLIALAPLKAYAVSTNLEVQVLMITQYNNYNVTVVPVNPEFNQVLQGGVPPYSEGGGQFVIGAVQDTTVDPKVFTDFSSASTFYYNQVKAALLVDANNNQSNVVYTTTTLVNAPNGIQDLIDAKADIGANLSTFTNDSGFTTAAAVASSLGSYVTSSALTTALAGYETTSALTSSLSSYATTTALTSGLAGKFNTPAGTTAQYVRGDGALVSFPSIPSAASGLTNDSSVSGSTIKDALNTVLTAVGNNATVYSGTTQKTGAVIYTGSANISSGTVVFNITSDGTGTGTALFPNGPIQSSMNYWVNDAAANYTASAAWSNSNKTLTLTVNKATPTGVISLLGLNLLGAPAAVPNGVAVNVSVIGN